MDLGSAGFCDRPPRCLSRFAWRVGQAEFTLLGFEALRSMGFHNRVNRQLAADGGYWKLILMAQNGCSALDAVCRLKEMGFLVLTGRLVADT